jgi:ribosomal protein L16 Arg81 hydroxylase
MLPFLSALESFFSIGTFAPKIPERMAKQVPQTPSKLMNRFKKNEDMRQTLPVTPIQQPVSHEIEEKEADNHQDNFRPTQNRAQVDESFWKFGSTDSHHVNSSQDRIIELENEVQVILAERDDLLREKKFWLTKFQTDNAKLVLLMQVYK